MRDTDGHTVFDTDERLFVATDRKTGSISLSGYTASNQNLVDLSRIDVGTYHALASINASADIVRGSFFVQTSGGSQGLANIGWFNAGGTYMHYFDGIATAGSPTGGRVNVTQIAAYTFVASGTTLYCHERVCLKAEISHTLGLTNSVTLLPVTLTYNLLCGTFV